MLRIHSRNNYFPSYPAENTKILENIYSTGRHIEIKARTKVAI